MSDYRNTSSCPSLGEISTKKKNLAKNVSSNHYDYVREGAGKQEFAKIYNNKCAYCGVLTDIRMISNFQIDHIICQSSERWKGADGVDDISNLAFSCKECNQSKHAFKITSDYDALLNPDLNLGSVFVRDEETFRINVSEKYKEDTTVNSFYAQLHFESNFRRVDYLLLRMHRLKETKGISEAISDKLSSLYSSLLDKVNNSVWTIKK